MKKINDRTTNRSKRSGESDAYRKFKEQFDKMFDVGEIARNDNEFEKLYVSDEDFEQRLGDFVNAKQDRINFCIGYTGIGKTTCLRHCFGLGVSNEAHFQNNSKRIVFPTFLDGYQVKDIKRFNLATRIAAVNTGLREEHPELNEVLRNATGKREFYNLIRKHTSFILEQIDPLEEIDNDDPNRLIAEKLKRANKKIH